MSAFWGGGGGGLKFPKNADIVRVFCFDATPHKISIFFEPYRLGMKGGGGGGKPSLKHSVLVELKTVSDSFSFLKNLVCISVGTLECAPLF